MYSYVIVFNVWENGLVHSQPIASGSDLSKAQKFIQGLAKGQKWASSSYTEGAGERFRRITDFGENDWTEYCIRRVETL